MLMSLVEKNKKLEEIIRDMGKILIAFSGGVDSTFLVAKSKEILGDQVLAVTASSETFPQREFQAAVTLANQLGVSHQSVQIEELTNENFVRNNPDRCFHCKSGLYHTLIDIAKKLGYPYICDGSNMDDMGDYRPGLKATRSLGIRSPLQEANLFKKEIRMLSKEMGLPTWNKPSFACLSSRIPYGTRITQSKINQLDEAENFLLQLGFHQIRVRHHEKIARLEVLPQDMEKVLQYRETIDQNLKKLGFSYVTLDLCGYRAGSMNEVLRGAVKNEH
ncbi:ATP-dependent sacrificial sulfur transferase LarE [Microaerobacter geothermalis]|nr:ATP-dependent sacrificial sulfur transferase LarE [Microaerobacter geothermalis]MCF6092405.1 ATP-dependent sacrificial sulfur transferase LarE [Microaerobacter geothermalis]